MSTSPPERDLTGLLTRARDGDAAAGVAFWNEVYGELRTLAGQHLENERPGHSLQTTSLVHEAYLRLLGARTLPFASRAHFFGAAARAMRRILVDHARARRRQKRGGGVANASLTGNTAAIAGPDLDLLALDEALAKLQKIDPRKVQVIELRFFAGLGTAEIAELLQVSVGTVSGDWQIARLWLHRELAGERTDGS